MKIIKGEIVVLDIAGNRALIACDRPDQYANLVKIGFVAEGGQMARKISDVADRQMIVRVLIEMGAIFSNGRDWCPSALVDFYRDQGAITTGYRMISWKNSDEYSIVDK
jgi:hypothetical protein